MNLKKIKNGTFLTIKRQHDSPIYIEVARIDIGKKVIKIWDQKVHSFRDVNNVDTYIGCDHFQDPYTFSMEEFNKKVSLTDLSTIEKIQKSFKKNGEKVCVLPSQSEINKNYKEMKRNQEIWRKWAIARLIAEEEKIKKKKEEERRKFLEFAFVDGDETDSGGVCPWKTKGDVSETSKDEDDWGEYECWKN